MSNASVLGSLLRKKLHPNALYSAQSARHARTREGSEDGDWSLRKSFSEQWGQSKKGLSEAEYQEGLTLCKRLDELENKHMRHLQQKAWEAVRKS